MQTNKFCQYPGTEASILKPDVDQCKPKMQHSASEVY